MFEWVWNTPVNVPGKIQILVVTRIILQHIFKFFKTIFQNIFLEELWTTLYAADGCSLSSYRSSRLNMFCKEGVLTNFTKLKGKHLCQNLFLNKVVG